MALAFLNAVRCYDAARQCISFWGYDATSEVAFRLDREALHHLVGHDSVSESGALEAFDANLKTIRHAAERLYRLKPGPYREISAADL